MVVGLWLVPFYIHVLGPNDYGIWLTGLQVLTFLSLADCGIIGVLARDVARVTGHEQCQSGDDQLAVLVGQTTKIVLVQTVLLSVASLGAFIFWPGISPNLKGPIGLVLATYALCYPLRIFPPLLQGLQDLNFLGQWKIWIWALSTGLMFLLVLAGLGFYALAIGWCAQQLGSDIVAFLRLRRIRPDLVSAKAWRKSGPLRWGWFTRGFWVSVSQVAYFFLTGVDVLILARVLGPATVVVYSCTGKLLTVLQNQPQLVAAVALPGLSQMRVNEPPNRTLNATTSVTQAMLLLVGAVFCIVLSINRQFVGTWVGADFFGGVMLTGLLLMNFVARQIDYTLAIALFAFGHERLSAIRGLLDAVVSVVAARIFVGLMGIEGVPLGFLCGALFVAIPIDVFVFVQEFKVSVFQVLRSYMPYLWRTAIVGAVGVGLTSRASTLNLPQLAGVAILVGSVYLLSVLSYARRTPLGSYIQSAVMRIRLAI